ncbi:MAG: TlpA disulfide reductase family protein [Candidatus Acidiferrales bacterium]
MKKSFIFVLAAIAGLTGIAIGLSAGRSNLIRVPKASGANAHVLPAYATPAVRNVAEQQSGQMPVVRFASNPQAAPPFLARDIDGNVISTAEWKDKVVLLNFWATWCPPCREEVPELVDLQARYKDRLQVIGISMDDPEDVRGVKKFAIQESVNYPIVMASREIILEYGGVPALPTSFVVNTESKVVQKHVGLYPTYVYETEVRALLGMPINATIETFKDEGQVFLKNAALATELPDVDFKDLTPEMKKAALRRMNSESCDCGCRLTLAQCRINDSLCAISKKLAAKVVAEVASNAPVPTSAPASSPDASAPTSNQQ